MPQIILLPGAHSSPQIRFKSAVAILAVEQRLLSYITSQISDPAGGEFLQDFYIYRIRKTIFGMTLSLTRWKRKVLNETMT